MQTVDEPTAREERTDLDQETVRLPQVTAAADLDGEPTADGRDGPADTHRDPVTDLFAPGETPDETPPTGQVRLGWEGPESRLLDHDDGDAPTWRVPRHRLREDG